MEYLLGFVLALGINIVLFIPAYLFKTDKLTDLSYSLSFFSVALVLLLFSTQSVGHMILFLMIALWAIRLGTYLFIRIKKMKLDKRFDGMREDFVRFLKFWVLQGVSVFVILLPSISYFAQGSGELTGLSLFGLCIWALGLLIETIADYQKYTFINNSQNKGKWIASGLWKYSRHPNYFGEILLWIGVYVFTLSGLTLVSSLIGLAGPLYIAAIILFVTGIPLLEKGADKRWGDDPLYQEYKKKTSVLILLPTRR